MDEARLAEIEARANAATPGPWRSGGFYGLARANDGDTAGWSHGAALPMGRCSFCGDATEPCPMAVMYQSDRDAAPRTYHARWLASPNGEGWQNISSAATALAIAGNYDYDRGGVCSTPEDSAFIAHSRDDVPALVAEVRRLRAIIASAERVCEAVHDGTLQPIPEASADDMRRWAAATILFPLLEKGGA